MSAILVIDDNPSVLETFEFFAEFYGVRIYRASSGHDGLDVWARSRGDISLIFLDYQLPLGPDGQPFDGDQVFRSMKDADENAKIVIITGFDYKIALPLMKEGVLDVIPKGVSMDRFHNTLLRFAPEVLPRAAVPPVPPQ